MRLILPVSNDLKQSLMDQVPKALAFGRLHTIREKSQADGTLVVSAKFTDSFGFVDHPRLTVHSSGELSDFRCDCAPFRRTGCLCMHCASLADAFFDEIRTKEQVDNEQLPPAEMEPSFLSLFQKKEPVPPSAEQISYRFCNSRYDLYPGKDAPRIPLSRYQQVFGKNARARALYQKHTSWGGSCFGFTTSASMFFTPGDPMSAPDFKADAAYPADLALTSRSSRLHMTLHTLLESMQILQYSNPLIQRPRNIHYADPNCLDELCQRVLHFQQTQEDPVAMGVARNRKFEGCHSVFPYWLEISPDGQDRLHIYDPNHPMKTRYAYLEKDENGHYTNWRFAMNDHKEYSSATDGQLFFDDYSDYKNAWDQRGGVPSEAMMSVPRNAAIANAEGKVLFRVTADGTESFCDDIYQVIVTDMGEESGNQVMLNLPAGHYLVRNEDPQQESMEVTLTHIQQSVTVRTNAPEVELMADDASMCVCARIPRKDCRYCVELDAVYEDDSRAIQLEGITAEGGLTFGCYDGILRSEGTLSEEIATLYIDEELSDLSCIQQQKAAVIQELPIQEQNLIANADQHENGPAVTE